MYRSIFRSKSAFRLYLRLGTFRALVVYGVLFGACAAVCAQTATDLLSQAQKLYDQGDRYRASPLFAKAEEQFRLVGDKRGELVAEFGRLHTDADHGKYKFVKAEIERDLATPIVQNAPELQIQALSLLGIMDLNIDTSAAGSDWKQVLEIATAIGDVKWQNRARGELGIVAGLEGKIGQAGMALFQAIATAQRIGDIGGAVNFTVWLANGMAVNGMADGALKQLDKATELAKQAGYQQLPFELSIARIRAMAQLPEPQRSQMRDQAEALFTTTLRLAETEKVFGAEIELLNQEGQLALASDNTSVAQGAFLKAASVAKMAELPGLDAEACLNLARVYLQMGQPQKAAASIKRGIADISGSEEAFDLPLFIGAQADTEAALGHTRAADVLYERASTLLEGLLVNAPSSQVKSSMVSAFSRIYVAHFRLAWEQLHDAPKAFQIIESARGRVLLDSIRYAQKSSATSGDSAPEIKIAKLQRTLIAGNLSAAQAKRVLDQLDSAYDQLGTSQFDRERKEVAILRHAPLMLTALMRLLGQHEIFVEYVLDRQASYAIEVSHLRMQVRQLPAGPQITTLTRSYLSALKAGKDARASAQKLYAILIPSAVTRGSDSLIVVPDGVLHLLPFAALQDERGVYLAQQATTSIAPSATVFAMLQREPEIGTPKTFLGVAFSQVGDEAVENAKTRGIENIRGADIKPLAFSREEVTEANSALGGHGVILEGATASEAELKSEPLAQFKVIHLAAHGVGDELQPDRAAIVLHPGSAQEDGLWQAREIRHTRLNADTVVLSACETGTGRLEGQEGIMNLARAFLTAGAKSVVASLWDIEDRSTATVMEGFYQHLAKGESVALALRSSQLEFLKTYREKASPYLWAGFEVIGDGTRTIVTPPQADLQATREHFR